MRMMTRHCCYPRDYSRVVLLALIALSCTDSCANAFVKENGIIISASSRQRQPPTTTVLFEDKDDLIYLAEELNPVVGFYDPLGLVDTSPWGFSTEQTIGWLRQSEIKHGRVSMAAVVGYIVQSHWHFPWALALDGTPFPSPDLNPAAQWDILPFAGKMQIILFVGFLEWYSELADEEEPHYVKGGKPGYYTTFESIPHWAPNLYDPLNIYRESMSESLKARRLRAELNNGRLAMIGIMGFLCEQSIPGSVPFLTDKIIPYAGEVMAPFEGNVEQVMDLVRSTTG